MQSEISSGFDFKVLEEVANKTPHNSKFFVRSLCLPGILSA